MKENNTNKDDAGEAFVTLLAPLMDALGVSPEAFAKEIGASASTVRSWLRGESEPTWKFLRRIVDAYGVAPSKLLPERKAA